MELDLAGDSGDVWRKFVRIRVDIPMGKPLFPGLFLPRPNNADCWIGLKYEKLADVCYKCGVVGHEEKSCTGSVYRICNPNGARFKAAGPWLRPGVDNLPPGIFEKNDGVSNGAAESSEQPPERVNIVEKGGTHEMTSPELGSSSVQVGTPERTTPTSCHSPRDHCTSPLTAQNAWQAHTIFTSTLSAGTSCNTPATSTLAELDLPQKTRNPHIATRSKVEAKLGFSTKAQNRGFRRLFRLTPVQVGLSSTVELADLSSDQKTSTESSLSPTHQRPVSEHSVSLTPQSTTFHREHVDLFPCSSSSVPNSECQPPYQELQIPQQQQPYAEIPPPNPLKRKETGKESELFTKRFRLDARSPEPIFFDPETVALIPQSSLEHFIIKERHLAEDEKFNCKSFYHNSSDICVQNNAISNMAEEAGLIMPPPSP